MTDNPRLSVIIPTFNRSRYIREALDSVLNQKNSPVDYEVIVVDDGSTDDTVSIIKNEYNNRVRLLKLDHIGKPGMVRNEAMKVAKGELIAFHDSDDVWVEDKFASQLSDFDDPEVVLSYGNCLYIDKDGNLLEDKPAVSNSVSPVEGYAFIQKVSKQASPTPTPTVIIRRNVIDKLGLFSEKLVIATDTDYWIRVSTVGKFKYCDKILAYMRRDGSNISSRPEESGDEAIFKHESNRVNMYRHLLEELDLTKNEKAVLQYRLAEISIDVAVSARMTGKESPVRLSDISFPPKPQELKDIDKNLSKSILWKLKDAIVVCLKKHPKTLVSVVVALKKILRLIKR